MKKFNLANAKEGHPVVTAKGKDVKILLFDRASAKFPVVAIIENREVCNYALSGQLYIDKKSDKDLKMKSDKDSKVK